MQASIPAVGAASTVSTAAGSSASGALAPPETKVDASTLRARVEAIAAPTISLDPASSRLSLLRRSEERRGGEEGRCRWWPGHLKKKKKKKKTKKDKQTNTEAQVNTIEKRQCGGD